MKRIFQILFTLLIIESTFAQNRYVIDSLLRQVSKEISPHKKYGAFIALAGEFVFTNADSAILFNTKSLEIAKSLKIDSLLANAYYAIASIEATRNNYDAALLNCDSAFKYFTNAGNKLALAMVRNVQGGVCMASGKNEMASRMFFDAIDYTKSDTASARILFTYHNLVILLNNMDKHQKALEYSFKQFEWAKRLNIPDEIAYACSNVVDTYIELKDSTRAVHYINEFIRVSKETQDPYLKVIAKNQLGILKYVQKQYDQSADYFTQSLQLNNNLVDQQLGCITLLSLGKVYQKMKLYNKADSCFLRAIAISRALNIKEERKSAFELLIDNAVLQNDYKKAFAFSQSLQSIKDSLLTEKSETALVDAESRYRLSEKQKELELLSAEKKLSAANAATQRTHKLIILFSGLTLLLIGGLLFNRYALKKKIEQHTILLNERTRISRELHDDLGGGLSTIRLMTEMIRNPGFGLNGKYLDNISLKSKELIQNMNEIVWYLNNNNDDLGSTVAYIRQFAGRMLGDANITLHFSEPDWLPDITMNGEIRRNIFLLVKEALHNIIKHSRASVVSITIHADDKLTISIADNGRGVDISEQSKPGGNGLKNMKARINNLKGSFQLLNNNGTTVIFSLPLYASYNKSVS
ncbi:MAG: tetratricopeptide repeat protein [Agriterribacter sp.]